MGICPLNIEKDEGAKEKLFLVWEDNFSSSRRTAFFCGLREIRRKGSTEEEGKKVEKNLSK